MKIHDDIIHECCKLLASHREPIDADIFAGIDFGDASVPESPGPELELTRHELQTITAARKIIALVRSLQQTVYIPALP